MTREILQFYLHKYCQQIKTLESEEKKREIEIIINKQTKIN